MNEISLHLLDIIQNSISANANLIEIIVSLDKATDVLIIEIKDNGCGMEEGKAKNVTDPFITGRTTRRVGLGLSLFKQSAEATGGTLTVQSKKNIGTSVIARLHYRHIDCPPLGNMTDTVLSAVIGNTDIDFCYRFSTNDGEMSFDTRAIKEILGEVPLATPDVYKWMQDSINEEINEICGGYDL